MKYLIYTFFLVLFVCPLFAATYPKNPDHFTSMKQDAWIQSLLAEQNRTIEDKDYLFYCTGHHGMIWSIIVSDSSGMSIYNGTTRTQTDHRDNNLTDTLSFINDNIQTIAWAFDSLSNAITLSTTNNDTTYNPVYTELYLKKDGNVNCIYNNQIDEYYTGADSVEFNNNFKGLLYLMYWLAAPSVRQYLHVPSDTSIVFKRNKAALIMR